MSFTIFFIIIIHYWQQRYGVLLRLPIHATKFVSTGLDRKNKRKLMEKKRNGRSDLVGAPFRIAIKTVRHNFYDMLLLLEFHGFQTALRVVIE